MKVVGYTRVSTAGQRDNGLSLEAQREKITLYARLHDLELIDIHEDASSGKTLERPGLSKALGDLLVGRASGVVVAKLDRLTRSLRDLDALVSDYFTRYALISTAENIDTSTAAGRMVLNVIMTVAQWEREAIGERTREAARHKKARGERWGKVPYGKRVAEDGVTLVDDPYEQEIIGAVGRLRRQDLSERAIVAELTRLGYHSREGKPLAKTQVHNILRATGGMM